MFSYPANAQCVFPLTRFLGGQYINYANVFLCWSGDCMHIVSNINRLVALGVQHDQLSTQFWCDWVSCVVSDWVVKSKLRIFSSNTLKDRLWRLHEAVFISGVDSRRSSKSPPRVTNVTVLSYFRMCSDEHQFFSFYTFSVLTVFFFASKFYLKPMSVHPKSCKGEKVKTAISVSSFCRFWPCPSSLYFILDYHT